MKTISGKNPGANKQHFGANKLPSGLIWAINCSDLGHSKRLFLYPCAHLFLDQVDPREADEDVAQAGGVRVLRLMKVSGELEVRVHVPRGWGKTEDESKEEVAPIKTVLCFFQPGFYTDPRSDFCFINLCARNLNCGNICLL